MYVILKKHIIIVQKAFKFVLKVYYNIYKIIKVFIYKFYKILI